jgi:hypothetical protein
MSVHRFYNNFTAGELTPLLDGRSDFAKYDNGLLKMENLRPLPYGGAKIRAGLEFIAETKDSDKVSRLVPFNFSTGTTFILEFGDEYIRFYSNDVQVESSPGVPYEVSSPYLEGEVFVLHVKELNDVMYITHPYHAPHKLTRVTDTNWTLEEIEWTYPPMREENTSAITMAISNAAIGTGRTLTASAAYFDADMVGGYYELRHLREGNGITLDINATAGTTNSSSLTVKGNWSVVTVERWYGTLKVQRSTDGGSTWETIRQFKSAASRNVSASGNEAVECLLRLSYTATGDPYGAGVWTGTAPANYAKATATLECDEAFTSGLILVTGYTDTTHLTVEVLQTVGSTAATDMWSEGAWSLHRGFPRTLGLYEQRLYFGGNSEKPYRFWGSRTGDFENFLFTDDDDGAVVFDIASTQSNPINWIEGQRQLLIGSSGDEVSAGAGDPNEPLTPSNISVRTQSSTGSELYQPIKIDKAVIFIQRQGKRLREFSYTYQEDGYVSVDLTILSEHIFRDGVYQLGFARMPDPLLLALNYSGDLAVMTYNREQEITAWARYVTDGTFESAVSIYGNDGDEVWCIVNRLINGDQRRYVERFATESDSKEDSKLLDSHVSGTLTDPFSGTISGLDHLDGETVRLVVAGAVIGDYEVSSGAITVDPEEVPTLGNYVVGLPYVARLKTMNMNIIMQNGPSHGKVRRVSEATINFYSTLGCKFGRNFDEMDEVVFRDVSDPMDASPPVFTGEKNVIWPSGYSRESYVCIEQDQPLPFTVLGIAVKADYFGD